MWETRLAALHSTPGPCAPFRPLAQIRQRSLNDRRPRLRAKTPPAQSPIPNHVAPTTVTMSGRQARCVPFPSHHPPSLPAPIDASIGHPPVRTPVLMTRQILPIDAHRYDPPPRLDPGGTGGRGQLGAVVERELLYWREVREVQ
jgi:hypothetical protein